MLANEKFYEESDIENMLPEESVKEPGEYWAIGTTAEPIIQYIHRNTEELSFSVFHTL